MKSLTLKEALLQLKKGLTSVQELCQACQHRIQKTKKLNIYISETQSKNLLQCIESSEQAYLKGTARALEGIPVAFKDNFCTQGTHTTCASKMLLNYVPPYDATMVTKCKEAGSINMGKTNMDEFAMGSGSLDSCFGPVINPWNLTLSSSFLSDEDSSTDWYIAGGSSGGSAAAVAAGTCLAAFGSDTGGSTRNPASYCGVVGLKPTYGLLSRHGLIPLVNSMDVPGIVTKTVEDSEIMLNVVAGHDTLDSTSVSSLQSPFKISKDLVLSKLHIGIPKEFQALEMSSEVLSLWKKVADILEKAGAKVTEVSMPHAQLCILCYHVLCCCEVASNFARYDGIEYGLRYGSELSTEELYAESRHKGFNHVVRSRILAGNYFLLKKNYTQYFIKAQKVRRLISDDFKSVFKSGVNILLTPTTLTEAPLFSWFTKEDHRTRSEEQDIFTTNANMAGVPAMSLPLGFSKQGLPLSLQISGPHFSESLLLSLAYWLEEQAQFSHLNLDFLDHAARSSNAIQ